jgi:hypothetical protein
VLSLPLCYTIEQNNAEQCRVKIRVNVRVRIRIKFDYNYVIADYNGTNMVVMINNDAEKIISDLIKLEQSKIFSE